MEISRCIFTAINKCASIGAFIAKSKIHPFDGIPSFRTSSITRVVVDEESDKEGILPWQHDR
jgi:hypothetical protein